MPDVGAALRGRTFGLPNGVLLLAVAAGIYWFFIRGKTGPKAATTNQAAAAGSQLESGYGLGFAQGQQAAQATQPAAATPSGPPHSTGVVTGAFSGGTTGARSAPSFTAPITRRIPAGTNLTLTGSQVPDPGSPGQAWYQTSQGDYVWAADISNVVAAVGGAIGGAIRKHHIGSRSSNPWHDGHPLIGAPVKYAHYVRVGGPGTHAAHRANINRVAQQAGVHPARVAMLNPVPTGLIRIA